MAYCVQCGNQVGDTDQFCGRCGTRQQGTGAVPPPRAGARGDFWSNLSSKNTALLCYIPWVGWIASIAILATERFRNDARMRFHAFQGLYIFVAWLMVEWVVQPFMGFPGFAMGWPIYRTIPRILQLLVFGSWIFMLIKVSNDEDYRLPIVGELADRSVSEQRS